MKNSFLVAAPSSNSGKTIITLGLIKALRNKRLTVQPFKCGPDYIDPIHHTIVAERSSYNLDLWMSNDEHIKAVFHAQMHDADIGVVEGVMGLFDGAKRDKGSSAEVAQVIDLPVVLIVNAAATAYSVAPLLYGFKNFNPNVKVKGVIFNKVSGESHYRFLKEAADDAGVVSLGYVPKDERLTLESRHLGLSLTKQSNMLQAVNVSAELIEQHVDLEQLLKISKKEIECKSDERKIVQQPSLKVAIAHDEAFNFMYPANVDVLKQLGEVIYFSPLHDSKIPDCDMLWFPGGYPELFAGQLAANTSMLDSIRCFEKGGGKLVAECGGMMYLGKAVKLNDGSLHQMLNVFDYETSLHNMKLRLGYRSVVIENVEFKGHEFHYSTLTEDCAQQLNASVKTARATAIDMPIYRNKNCWSSYFHIYLGEKEKMDQFVRMMMA